MAVIRIKQDSFSRSCINKIIHFCFKFVNVNHCDHNSEDEKEWYTVIHFNLLIIHCKVTMFTNIPDPLTSISLLSRHNLMKPEKLNKFKLILHNDSLKLMAIFSQFLFEVATISGFYNQESSSYHKEKIVTLFISILSFYLSFVVIFFSRLYFYLNRKMIT